MLKDEIAKYGFSIAEDILEPSDIRSLNESLASAPQARSRAGLRHVLRNPHVLQVANDTRLKFLASEVLGADPFPFRATFFDKSRISNWLVVWHQDTALPLRERREVFGWGPWSVKDGVTYAHATGDALSRVVALRVHLDDSIAENGPLRVLPGTHTQGVLSDESIHQLSVKIGPVDCLVSRGGVLMMRPLILHASSKSKSQLPRRVLHIEYAASAVLGDGLELAAS